MNNIQSEERQATNDAYTLFLSQNSNPNIEWIDQREWDKLKL